MLPVSLILLACAKPVAAAPQPTTADPVVTISVAWPETKPGGLEVSALDRVGERWVLAVPQNEDPAKGRLLLLPVDKLQAAAEGRRVRVVPVDLPTPFEAPVYVKVGGTQNRLTWDGFEAVRVGELRDGKWSLRLVSEWKTNDPSWGVGTAMVSCVHDGWIAEDGGSAGITGTPIEGSCAGLEGRVEKGGELVAIPNSGAESIIEDKGGYLLFPELFAANGGGHARRFGVDGLPVSLPRLPWRVTDATRPDGEGRFWVINYLYPKNAQWCGMYPVGPDPLGVELKPVADCKATLPAPHERLVELKRDATGVNVTKRVVVLQPEPGSTGRNWEGITRLDTAAGAGVLIVTDQFPDTRMGWVKLP